jgi:phosphohistidine swiveling domain-containing protein
VQPDCVGGGIGLGIGTGVWGHSANADAQQHNINVAAKNITATGSQHEEKMEEMEFMAGIISRNQLLVIKFAVPTCANALLFPPTWTQMGRRV